MKFRADRRSPIIDENFLSRRYSSSSHPYFTHAWEQRSVCDRQLQDLPLSSSCYKDAVCSRMCLGKRNFFFSDCGSFVCKNRPKRKSCTLSEAKNSSKPPEQSEGESARGNQKGRGVFPALFVQLNQQSGAGQGESRCQVTIKPETSKTLVMIIIGRMKLLTRTMIPRIRARRFKACRNMAITAAAETTGGGGDI